MKLELGQSLNLVLLVLLLNGLWLCVLTLAYTHAGQYRCMGKAHVHHAICDHVSLSSAGVHVGNCCMSPFFELAIHRVWSLGWVV